MKDNNLLQNFKKTGRKLTTPRKIILQTLSSSTPLSAQEVFLRLAQKGHKTDLVTIYRSLELFLTLGMVNKIQFENNLSRYELALENHHHHLICLRCNKIEDAQVDEASLLNIIKKNSSFKVLRHSLEFFGECNKCQGQI